jgi:hypothetical protein
MPEPVKDLAKAFLAPPPSTRPYFLWMWMGSNISGEGITRDLEAMREAGIGGATIFSLADTVTPWAGVILKSPTPEIVTLPSHHHGPVPRPLLGDAAGAGA